MACLLTHTQFASLTRECWFVNNHNMPHQACRCRLLTSAAARLHARADERALRLLHRRVKAEAAVNLQWGWPGESGRGHTNRRAMSLSGGWLLHTGPHHRAGKAG